MAHVLLRDPKKCERCGYCRSFVSCSKGCVGCGACSISCPNDAIEIIEIKKPGAKNLSVVIDGEAFFVPKTTVKEALEGLGFEFLKYPEYSDKKEIFTPCGTGGCLSCAIEIDGELMPSCTTPLKDGMIINTREDLTPKRLVQGFGGHGVGGVGTPWPIKEISGFVEVACFTSGCNFRCPQCQNWVTTYRKLGEPKTPRYAAEKMTLARERFSVDRMAISGGECTLNRRWLLSFVKELKELNNDEYAHIHVDTNGSILTDDYIDDLVGAGTTDIGIDLKSLDIGTFIKITGIEDRDLAQKYQKTAWGAVKYIIDNHNIFLGIGIPYNSDFVSLDEVAKMGDKIFKLSADVQVCVLDYRPAFRKKNVSRPNYAEMGKVYSTLLGTGLKTVICQTAYGYIGP